MISFVPRTSLRCLSVTSKLIIPDSHFPLLSALTGQDGEGRLRTPQTLAETFSCFSVTFLIQLQISVSKASHASCTFTEERLSWCRNILRQCPDTWNTLGRRSVFSVNGEPPIHTSPSCEWLAAAALSQREAPCLDEPSKRGLSTQPHRPDLAKMSFTFLDAYMYKMVIQVPSKYPRFCLLNPSV